MNRQFFVLLALVALSGCASYHPLPVGSPGKAEYDRYKDTSANAIPLPQKISDAKQYAWTYAEHYRNKKNELFKSIYGHSDWSSAGTIVAMIAGVGKSPVGVVAGGALAAGPQIVPARYQFSLQASNFLNAEKSAMCVFDHLRKLTSEEEINLAVYEYINAKTKDNTVADLTHVTFKQIHARLENAQSTVTLLSPDLGKLQQALDGLKKPPSASPETLAAADKATSAATEKAKSLGAALPPPLDISSTLSIPQSEVKTRAAAGDEKLQDLKAKFEVCILLISV
jgi:hypothetical protein